MAGSLKWFEYTTDDSNAFALFMDESNGEAVGNVDYGTGSTAQYKLPGNVKPRYARYSDDEGLYARNISCSTQAVLAAAPAAISVQDGNGNDVVLAIRQRVGEVVQFIPRAGDTGIVDGDAT